jgi:hypothetical protein
MEFREIVGDLFVNYPEYHLAHCVSADFELGAGIALVFEKKFALKEILKGSGYYWDPGSAVLIEDLSIFNLVTKRLFWNKPTYTSLRNSLIEMRDICVEKGILKVSMPIIGCGLDKLEWVKVKTIIQEVFAETEVEILVCHRK